jgi:dCMP deaminase
MRDDWDTYFMKIANLVSTRATCDRKHVGAVIVRDNRVLTTGYNGAIPGLSHCDDVGHDLEENHCVRVVHSECNAIIQAAKIGVSVDGATLYCNTVPCWNCFKTIVSAGIREVVWDSDYSSQGKSRVFEAASKIPGFVIRKFENKSKSEEDANLEEYKRLHSCIGSWMEMAELGESRSWEGINTLAMMLRSNLSDEEHNTIVGVIKSDLYKLEGLFKGHAGYNSQHWIDLRRAIWKLKS